MTSYTGVLCPELVQQFWNLTATSPAAPVGSVSYVLYTYLAGTTTPTTTWTDASLGAIGGPNTNPIVLNAAGQANIFLNPAVAYKFVYTTSVDTNPPTSPIYTVDNVWPALTGGSITQSIIGAALYPQTAAEIAAGITPTYYYYPAGNVLRYGADPAGATDSTSAFQSCHNANNRLYMPNGSYLLNQTTQTTAFTISKSEFYMFGDGPDSQIIHTETSIITQTVGVVQIRPISQNIQDIILEKFRITGPTANTGGAQATGSQQTVQGIVLMPVNTDSGNIYDCIIDRVIIEKMGFCCFAVNGATSAGVNYYCRNILFLACTARYSRQDGFNDDAGYNFDIQCIDCIAHDLDGPAFEMAGAGDMVEGCVMERCGGGIATDYNATASSALIAGTTPYTAPGQARKIIRNNTITACHTTGTPKAAGIEISESAPALYTTIANNDISQCGGSGILFNQLGSFCDVMANRIRDVGLNGTTQATQSGIYYGNLQTDSTCLNNSIDTTSSGFTMVAGIYAAVGPHVAFTVANNSIENASQDYFLPTNEPALASLNFQRNLPDSVNYGTSQNLGTGATALGSYTVPANMLEAVNMTLKYQAWGNTAANTHSKVIALLWGTTTIIGGTSTSSGVPWSVNATFGVTTNGTAAVLTYYGQQSLNGSGLAPTVGTFTGNLLTTNTLGVVATGTSTGDITQTGLYVEYPNSY